jgi:glycosyltransferase involved in cell wall biosynthesis
MISVLMTAYNAEKYISSAILSIINQTYTDWELIVVDDCSTDGTHGKVEEIKARYPDKKIWLDYMPENKGHTRAMIAAMKSVKGELIAWQDSDDVSCPMRFEEQIKCFETPKIGVCTTWAITINTVGNRINNWYTDSAQREKKTTISDKFRDDCWICLPSMMWRREVVEKIGSFDDKCYYAQDFNYYLRILRHYDFAIVQKELFKYRKHVDSVRSSNKYKDINWHKHAIKRAQKEPVICY